MEVVRSGVVVVAAIEHAELLQLHALMSRYWDRPNGLHRVRRLVYLAKRESLSTILTVDHGDLKTYCVEAKRQFRVLPTGTP